MFTLSLSLVITSLYPCLSLYANVKCPSRDNTSPYSSFWRDNCIWPRGHSKMKIANLKEARKQNGGIRFFFSPRRETETLFFYPCGGVLLNTNLSLTPSCWHIGHKFFDSLLMISSGRAVFGSPVVTYCCSSHTQFKVQKAPWIWAESVIFRAFSRGLPHC